MSWSIGKADAAPIAGAPVLVFTKRLGRVGRISSAGGYASCDLASSISRAACAQDDPSFIRYARNSGSLSVSANRTHSPARFRHSCGSLIMASSCNDQRQYVTSGGIPNEFELVTKATYFARGRRRTTRCYAWTGLRAPTHVAAPRDGRSSHNDDQSCDRFEE